MKRAVYGSQRYPHQRDVQHREEFPAGSSTSNTCDDTLLMISHNMMSQIVPVPDHGDTDARSLVATIIVRGTISTFA